MNAILSPFGEKRILLIQPATLIEDMADGILQAAVTLDVVNYSQIS